MPPLHLPEPLRPLTDPVHLSREATQSALDVLVVASAALGILWLAVAVWREIARRRALPTWGRAQAATPAWTALDERGGPRVPLLLFLLSCTLLFANQVLVNVYILLSHQGDPTFVARFVGPGWFVLATDSAVVRWAALHLPASAREHLPYSILRVNAALELPFVITAYLSIAALLGRDLAARIWRSLLLPLALLGFTATFCLIEMRLWNPWTLSDLRWRWVSCAVGLALWGVSRLVGDRDGALLPAASAASLANFCLGGGALAAAVLLMYDVTLLYNLGHLGRIAVPLAGCGALALLCAGLSRPAARVVTTPALSGASAVLVCFTLVFFVPSLAIRYCGPRPIAAAAGAVLLCAACLAAAVLTLQGQRRWWGALGLLVLLGCGAAVVWADVQGRLGLPWPGPSAKVLELRLLRGALLGLFAGLGAAALVDLGLAVVGRISRGRAERAARQE